MWSLICQIPATSVEGTYSVRIYASDVAGNSRQLPMDQSDATFTVTSGGGGPALVSVQVPASVAAGESLTVTWRLVDAAEVASTQAQVVDPFGEAYETCCTSMVPTCRYRLPGGPGVSLVPRAAWCVDRLVTRRW